MQLTGIIRQSRQKASNVPGARGMHNAFIVIAIALVLGACSSLPTDYERIPSHAIADTADTRLGQRLQPHLDANPGKSGFYTLTEGEVAYAARVRAIMAAEKTIDTQYYIWHDDLTGRYLHNQLLAAADRGVRVRMLLDDLDTAGKDEILRKIDAHPNIEIRLFNPFANRNKRARDFIGDTRRINRRMHNKTLTADSLVTIFGGRNIGDEYFAATEDVGFGDMDALAVGPIAMEVSQQFDLYWNSENSYPITAFKFDDEISDDAVAAFRADSDAYAEQAKKTQYADIIRQYDVTILEELSSLGFVWSDWKLIYDQPSKVTAKKVTAETHLAPRLKAGMDKTQKDLIIVSPYFVPGEEFTAYLTGLVERGVRVRILTNSLQANDVSMVHAGYMRYREDLVAGGVELYEFKALNNKLRKRDERARIGASKASLHAKFFGFDETYLFIGSFNLDGRSVALNSELGAYFASPEQAKALSEIFENDILGFAYRVTLDEGGDLAWTTLSDGAELTLTKEPDTTWWKRFSTGFLSFIVPESQL
jgi:cardiolipin synthase C